MQNICRLSPAALTARAAAVVLLAAALGACATSPAPDSPGAGTSLNQAQTGGPSRWELVRWQQADGTLKSIPHGDNGQPIIFEFNSGIDSAQGTVSGYSGCNRFTGGYGKTATGMRFDRLAGTRMACIAPGGELESALLKAMQLPFTTVGTQPSAGSTGRQIIWKTADGDLLQFVEREGVGRRGAKMDAQAAAGGVEDGVCGFAAGGVLRRGPADLLSRAREPGRAVDALVWADRGAGFRAGRGVHLAGARDAGGEPADGCVRDSLAVVERGVSHPGELSNAAPASKTPRFKAAAFLS